MGFWSRWIGQATEITRLRNELSLACSERTHLETLLGRADDKTALLEKEVKRLNTAKDKIVLRYADQVSKQVGLPQHFVQDAVEKPEKAKPEVDEALERQIEWQATEQRRADEERGIEPKDLDWYIEIIRENPSRWIIS